MSYKCGKCKKTHETVAEGRNCYSVASVTPHSPAEMPKKVQTHPQDAVPTPPTSFPSRPGTAPRSSAKQVLQKNRNLPPTGPQLYRINKEANRVGERVTTWPTTRSEASTVIGSLVQKQTGSGHAGAHSGLVGYVDNQQTPTPTTPQAQPLPAGPVGAGIGASIGSIAGPTINSFHQLHQSIGESFKQPTKPEPLEERMVKRIPSGRYAVENNDATQMCFMRVRHYPNEASSKYAGSTVIQSKSADRWIKEQVYWKSGHVQTVRSGYVHGTELAEIMIQILGDPMSASLAYSDKYDECCRCGIGLTDKRSRWFGIGPECEKHRPDIINHVINTKGEFDPNASETE